MKKKVLTFEEAIKHLLDKNDLYQEVDGKFFDIKEGQVWSMQLMQLSAMVVNGKLFARCKDC